MILSNWKPDNPNNRSSEIKGAMANIMKSNKSLQVLGLHNAGVNTNLNDLQSALDGVSQGLFACKDVKRHELAIIVQSEEVMTQDIMMTIGNIINWLKLTTEDFL